MPVDPHAGEGRTAVEFDLHALGQLDDGLFVGKIDPALPPGVGRAARHMAPVSRYGTSQPGRQLSGGGALARPSRSVDGDDHRSGIIRNPRGQTGRRNVRGGAFSPQDCLRLIRA